MSRSAQLPNPGQMTAAQAYDLAQRGAGHLVDVRELDEFAAGHAPGALHLPLVDLVAGAALPPGIGGRPVLVICRSGNRSQRAAQLFAERGIQALNVTGGLTAWAQAGLPVTTPDGEVGQVS
jgi:rhodanese-related sulfurtransferase